MRRLSLALCILLCCIAPLAGCAATPPGQASPSADSAAAQTPPAPRTFVDSAGREVQLPDKIERVVPSGVLAQVYLYTISPDLLVGLTTPFTDDQKAFVQEKYASLPVLGQMYGTKGTFNLEAVLATDPDIIIDIGQAKKTVAEDMDSVQQQTGIPTIFIEATLETLPEAYRTLGELLGCQESAEEQAAYVEATLGDIGAKRGSIAQEDRIRVYYGDEELGLSAVPSSSIHSDTLAAVGAINVADIEKDSEGKTVVSFEQLLLWDPDVVILVPETFYPGVADNAEWNTLRAIQQGKYYESPNGPYNWMGFPPSVNRVLGLKWLGNLLYPELYSYDMIAEAQAFYRLFYHYDLTADEAAKLMERSTFKSAE